MGLREVLDQMQGANDEYKRLCPGNERPVTPEQKNAAAELAFRWLDVAYALIKEENVGALRAVDEASQLFELAESTAGRALAARIESRAWLEAMPPHPEAWSAAEAAARRSYELCDPDDVEGRGKARAQLGVVWLARAKAARDPQLMQEDAKRAAIELTAARDVITFGIAGAAIENNLGAALAFAGDSSGAFRAFLSSIQGYQHAGEILVAADVQQNAAAMLLKSGRFDDVRDLLRAARTRFLQHNDNDRVGLIDQMLDLIDQFQARWPKNG